MSDILSQAEIEALLTSLNPSEEGEPTPEAGAAPKVVGTAPKAKPTNFLSYELYDFRRPDKFSKEQLRSLQMLHETFGRVGGTSLSAFLRNTVQIEMISLEQVPYEEYLRSINQSVFVITSMPPLSGQAVVEIEFSLVFAMIDKLLGGPGRTIDRTVLSEIEEPLVRQLIERMFAALKTAWEGIVIINPGIEGMETSAQFVQIAPPSDIVVSILFEVKVGDIRGAMSLCIPYMVLKPITTKLSSQRWFTSGQRKGSAAQKSQLFNHVKNTRVDLSIALGTASLKVRDFLQLNKGDVLVLDQRRDKDLLLSVSGAPKLLGQPALEGKRIVFTVTEPYTQR